MPSPARPGTGSHVTAASTASSTSAGGRMLLLLLLLGQEALCQENLECHHHQAATRNRAAAPSCRLRTARMVTKTVAASKTDATAATGRRDSTV